MLRKFVLGVHFVVLNLEVPKNVNKLLYGRKKRDDFYKNLSNLRVPKEFV